MHREYRVKKELRPNGAIRIIVEFNGIIINKSTRAPKRRHWLDYQYALVIFPNQSAAIAELVNEIDNKRRFESICRSAAANDDSALLQYAAEVGAPIDETTLPYHRELIAQGIFQRTAEETLNARMECENKLARLQSGPQPEFSIPSVASYHTRRDLVPIIKCAKRYYDVIPLPRVRGRFRRVLGEICINDIAEDEASSFDPQCVARD